MVSRGDVYWVDFGPAHGAELAGTRPAVVVQNNPGNRFSQTTIVAGITTRFAEEPYPVIARLPHNALPRPSAVNCAQVRTIDMARLGDLITHLDDEVMADVDQALRISLGMY